MKESSKLLIILMLILLIGFSYVTVSASVGYMTFIESFIGLLLAFALGTVSTELHIESEETRNKLNSLKGSYWLK